CFFVDDDFLHNVACANCIDHIKPFYDLAKNGVVSIEVFGVLAVMANKELGSSCIAAGMCHRQYATIVILIVACQLAVNGISGATISNSVRATTLNNEVWNYAVESKPVVKSFLRKCYKIFDGVRRIFLKEFNLHYAFFCVNFS